MKRRNKQGKSWKHIILIIMIFLISLSVLSLAACNKNPDVASISIIEDTVPQNVKVSEFDITQVSISVLDSEGKESKIFASPSMLTTESRNLLKTGGTHNITLMYYKKLASFTVTLFEDDAETVTITFKDNVGNIITTITTLKGESVTPPAHPVIEGQEADGWVDTAKNKVLFNSVNESIEVKAQYTKQTQLHTVTFQDYQGNTVDTMEVEHGKLLPGTPSYELPDGIADYDWYYGQNKLNITNLSVTQNLLIRMEVEYIKHTVVYQFKDSDGEMITLGQETVNHNTAAKGSQDAIDMLFDLGYNFIRWKTAFNSVKMDLTVEAEAAIFSYTVNFLDFNDTIIRTVEVKHGSDVIPPEQAPTPTGSIFNHQWIGGSLQNVTSNLNLKAEYIKKRIKITLYNVPGIDQKEVEGDFGTEINADNLKNLVEEGDNILLGLYEDSALTQPVSLPYIITTNIPFYTKWIDTMNGNEGLSYLTEEQTKILTAYTGNDAIIYIPSKHVNLPITEIDSEVFKDKEIIKVNFGENIKEIKSGAFQNTKLTGALELPDGLLKIGAYAFASCTELTSVTIPDSVTEISSYAFSGATKLQNIYIGSASALSALSDYVFSNCPNLQTISALPNAITTIGKSSFEGSGLTSINLNKVTTVGIDAFKNCISLATVQFGEVNAIAEYAFYNTAIAEIDLSKVTSLESFAFANSRNLSLAVIGKITTLKANTFAGCVSLTNVTFITATEGEATLGVQEIQDNAFGNCISLTVINLPITLQSISAKAFSGALKLNEITTDSEHFFVENGILYDNNKQTLIIYPAGKIAGEFVVPQGVTTIAENAFNNAIIAKLVLPSTITTLKNQALYSRYISTIEFMSEQSPDILDDSEQEMDIISDWLWKLYVPEQGLASYQALVEFTEAEQTPVPYVENSLYDETSGLIYIIVDEKIKIVAANRLLNVITVPTQINGISVNAIGDYAFQNCDMLQTINITANLDEIGEYAFAGCTSLSTINFSTIKRATSTSAGSIINLNAFEDTPWYKNKNLIVIADTAFEYKFIVDEEGNNVIANKHLIISSDVEVLVEDLFNNQAGKELESIVLPAELEIIGDRAFFGINIETIAIPSQVNTLGESVFENCAQLKSIDIKNAALSSIPKAAFKGCSSLETVILPLNIRTIHDEAFMNCTSLREITLPGALSKIGNYAFYGCISMPTINLSNRFGVGLALQEKAIGDQAFKGCNSLVYVRIWNPTPFEIGSDVFETFSYIYVQGSDGDILDDYKTEWEQYSEQIMQQDKSPTVSYITNLDDQGNIINVMKDLNLESQRISVLYDAPALPEFDGYMFVCWTYWIDNGDDTGVWEPVNYPFLIPKSISLKAKWVRLDEGSLTDEDMEYNFEKEGLSIDGHNGTDKKVVIPSEYKGEKVVQINSQAFMDKDLITDIIFIQPSNIISIGDDAFKGMLSITSIILPSSLIEIGTGAFDGCINLEYIFIPKSVEKIGENAFANCGKLQIEFEEGSNLKDAYINSFESTLWYSEQKSNEQSNFVIAGRLVIEYLKNEDPKAVRIPTNAIALRKELFMNDPDIVTATLHTSIEYIGDKSFYNCSSLMFIDFSDLNTDGLTNISYIGDQAFAETPWSRELPEFEQVGGVLIKYNDNGTNEEGKVDLPSYITIIGRGAFEGSAIKEITLSSNLKVIADNAFKNCVWLENVVIPATVTSIGKQAFYNNIRLKTLQFSGNILKDIGDEAFKNCTSLGQLSLPSSLEMLGASAFEGCSSLTSVAMPNAKVKIINEKVFSGATSLTSVSLPNTVEIIGDNAFDSCTNLINLTVEAGSVLREISGTALDDTDWYKRQGEYENEDLLIILGDILLKYRHKTTDSQSSQVIVPDHIKYIAPNAFSGANIISINLPQGLFFIGESAFSGCGLLEVIIPNSVETIDISAFQDCTRLETVYLGSGLKEIKESAFAGCITLTKVVINKMGYEGLSETQLIEIDNAIRTGSISNWIANHEIFSGTMASADAFNGHPLYLRIYVNSDSLGINKELYSNKWTTLSNRIFNSNQLPTVSFVSAQFGEEIIAPISTEYLTEEDLQTSLKGFTLLGWEIVSSVNDPQQPLILLPYKVKENITLRARWLKNNRESDYDPELGFAYTPNATQNAYYISSYNGTSELLVIPSAVRGYKLLGINSGVFTAGNTEHVKTIMITNSDNLAMFSQNPFGVFANLEKIIVNGKTTNFATVDDYYNNTGLIQSNYVTIDGVLFTNDLKTIVAYPSARKANDIAITSYEIPFGIEKILAYAFQGSSLTQVTIPSSIMYIGEGAFNGNVYTDASTDEIKGLQTIAFYEDVQLSDIEIREIAFGAFDETAWYQNMTDSFKILGTYLLSYTGYNEEVVIPDTIKTIGIKAFENSSLDNIIKLTIPASVIRINEDAFADCQSIATILFVGDSSLMYAANDVFNNTAWLNRMSPDVNEFVIAGNILLQYKGGRDDLSNLEEILPDEVKVIGHNAFQNQDFSNITLPDSIVRIDENAFFACYNLTEIIIPSSVTEIGDYAFNNCYALSSVTFEDNSQLVKIGQNAFSQSSNLTSIIIPDTVQKVGNSAFEGCVNMTSATITPNSELNDLGSSAFKGAKKLLSIYIPNGLKEIKESTFEGCESLIEFTFSNSNKNLTKIGKSAFKNCLKLGSKLINRTNLLTVELPTNVNTIETEAFSGCSSMYGIKMQGQITYIGINAFYNCNKLANVTISTSEPPEEMFTNSFNYSAHPKLRVYVNVSPAYYADEETAVFKYRASWGGIVAANDNILERKTENLPKVEFYDYTPGGEEILLSSDTMNAELLSANILDNKKMRHDIKGMAIGFYKSNNYEVSSQICTATNPFEIVQDNTLKVYVKWENS